MRIEARTRRSIRLIVSARPTVFKDSPTDYDTAVNPETFLEAAAALGRPVDAPTLERILELRRLLEAGNERASLTTRVDESSFLEVHVLDSLSIARALVGEAEPRTLLDVGSGA